MKFLSSRWLNTPGAVKTTSRFRKWWLSTFRGYTVVKAIEHPDKMRFGHLTYSRVWMMKPPT